MPLLQATFFFFRLDRDIERNRLLELSLTPQRLQLVSGLEPGQCAGEHTHPEAVVFLFSSVTSVIQELQRGIRNRWRGGHAKNEAEAIDKPKRPTTSEVRNNRADPLPERPESVQRVPY